MHLISSSLLLFHSFLFHYSFLSLVSIFSTPGILIKHRVYAVSLCRHWGITSWFTKTYPFRISSPVPELPHYPCNIQGEILSLHFLLLLPLPSNMERYGRMVYPTNFLLRYLPVTRHFCQDIWRWVSTQRSWSSFSKCKALYGEIWDTYLFLCQQLCYPSDKTFFL